jgi:hypothetical protein
MPKSAIFAWSFASNRMFEGLRSEWMIPFECVNASPFAISIAIRTASPALSGPARSIRALSDPPARCSITMYGRLSTSPTSYTETTFACEIWASDRASFTKLRRSVASAAAAVSRTLIATSRLSAVSFARYTWEEPPAPSGWEIW